MIRWPAAGLVSGVGAAIAAGILFCAVNGIYQVNGVGLLRRQEWPINSLWAWVTVGFALGVVVEFIRGARRADHARKTPKLAEEYGREYAESYSLPPGARSMPLFAGCSDGRHAMTNRKDHVTVFDYTAVIQNSEGRNVTEGTAALFPLDGLPAFDLHPRTFSRRVLGWAGLEGLTFDPAAADPAHAETVKQFTKLFYVDQLTMPGTPGTPPESPASQAAGREEAVRRLFTPALMELVNQYPGYAIQSRPGFLAVWRGSGVLPAQRRSELWDAAVALRSYLIRSPQKRAGPLIPARAGTDASAQTRKLANTALGGLVGCVVGFILSAMAMSIGFFRQVPGPEAAPGFFLQPMLFVGFALCGAVIGAGIGSRLSVGNITKELAEDPARRTARQRAIGCAVLVGLLGGFFGGFAAFAASKVLVEWKLDDFGVDAALFSGSIFGGALLGAMTCGMTVNFFYRWREPRTPSACALPDDSVGR